MRSKVALSALALWLLAACATPAQPDPTVYRTRTGKKYHLERCSYLNMSKVAVKLSAAKRMGLTACSRCKPPR